MMRVPGLLALGLLRVLSGALACLTGAAVLWVVLLGRVPGLSDGETAFWAACGVACLYCGAAVLAVNVSRAGGV